MARIASDREAAKRDALDHEAYVAQQQVAAAKREANERNTEEGQAAYELEVRRRAELHEQVRRRAELHEQVRRRAELHEQAMAQQAELLQQTAAAETQRQQRRL